MVTLYLQYFVGAVLFFPVPVLTTYNAHNGVPLPPPNCLRAGLLRCWRRAPGVQSTYLDLPSAPWPREALADKTNNPPHYLLATFDWVGGQKRNRESERERERDGERNKERDWLGTWTLSLSSCAPGGGGGPFPFSTYLFSFFSCISPPPPPSPPPLPTPSALPIPPALPAPHTLSCSSAVSLKI
ncbi:hypothetical protein LX32DRAFT_250730 [Colletotrichum zoysiae]|uniref:Uncharacterized protein n=1 Tax=Colletotrichum zoysiae TaxID=1216348 RepID=A0AAD9H4R5_9PEZI|nr:hypothetical protein LX32DRAFT_250730 [Colletotrichum zoysiae]